MREGYKDNLFYFDSNYSTEGHQASTIQSDRGMSLNKNWSAPTSEHYVNPDSCALHPIYSNILTEVTVWTHGKLIS